MYQAGVYAVCAHNSVHVCPAGYHVVTCKLVDKPCIHQQLNWNSNEVNCFVHQSQSDTVPS